jgi:hypothetical protein
MLLYYNIRSNFLANSSSICAVVVGEGGGGMLGLLCTSDLYLSLV